MASTKLKNDEPPAVGANNKISTTIEEPLSPVALGRNCKQCLTYLTRALDNSSRSQSLLRALGAIPHSTINSSENKLYAPAKGGRGVMISLEKPSAAEELAVHHKSNIDTNHQLHATDERQDIQNNATLGRRFTQAANVLVESIKHSAEDRGVLTTSPTNAPSKDVATITIECMLCGDATRAEAGARAFVRGPEPLSIVLCSNRLSSQREIDEVLVHELVHVYDVHSRQMDLRECKQLAYSEIRAAREAECSSSLTSFTANICSKDKATVATRNMFPEQGRKCVCDVFDAAMKDLAPFATDSEQPGRNRNFFPPSQSFSSSQQSDR